MCNICHTTLGQLFFHLPPPNILTAAEAAKEKACTTQAIYNALNRGDLNEFKMGGIRL